MTNDLNEMVDVVTNTTKALEDVINALNESVESIDTVIEKKNQARIDAESKVRLASEENTKIVDGRDLTSLDTNARIYPDYSKMVLLKDLEDNNPLVKPETNVHVNLFLNDLRELLDQMFIHLGDSIFDNGYYIVLDRLATEVYLVILRDRANGRYTWTKVRVPFAKENWYLNAFHKKLTGTKAPIPGDFSSDTIFLDCDIDKVTHWKQELFRTCTHDLIHSTLEFLGVQVDTE